MIIDPRWTFVPVYCASYADRDGNAPVNATVLFEASAPEVVAATQSVGALRFRFPVNADGSFAAELPATDDPNINLPGFTWRCTEEWVGGRKPFDFSVPIASLPSGINLATVAPVYQVPQTWNVLGVLLTGLTAGTNAALQATDSILQGMAKLQAQFNAVVINALAATLIGLSTSSEAVIVAADTCLQAFGKLQGQITRLFKRTLYVNPATGNDSTGTGRESAPFQTIYHAASVGGDYCTIRVVGSSAVKEPYINFQPHADDTAADWVAGLGVTGVRILGTEAQPVVMNNFAAISGGATWTKLGGYSNIWYTDVVHLWSAVAGRGYPAMLESNVRMTQVSYQLNTAHGAALPGITDDATAKAYVDANERSFQCVRTATLTEDYNGGYLINTSYRYYVHATGGGSPAGTGLPYYFANRRAINLGTGNELIHAAVLGGVEHNGVLGYLRCYLEDVLIFAPGAHGSELVGCRTKRVHWKRSNIAAYTAAACHNYTPLDHPFDITYHQDSRITDWTGTFTSGLGGHTDGTGNVVGKLIAWDGLTCQNVKSIVGGNGGFCSLFYIRNLVGRDCGALGAPTVNVIIDDAKLDLNGEALAPADTAGYTVTMNDGQVVVRNAAMFRNRISGAGKFIGNRCLLIQLGVDSTNSAFRFAFDCEGLELNDCALSGPVGAPNASLGISGTLTTLRLRGSTVARSFNLPSTCFPDQTCVRADPLINFNVDGVGAWLDAVNSPHRFRALPCFGLSSAPLTNDPNDVLALCNGQIRYLLAGTSTFTDGPIYSVAGVSKLKYVGDATLAYFAAMGAAGALHRGTVSGGWGQVNVGGRTNNWTGVAGNTNVGNYTQILCDDAGGLTQWDISTDTFTNLASPATAALRDMAYQSNVVIGVGDNGNIVQSIGGAAFTKAADAAILATDNILLVTAVTIGGTTYFLAVGVAQLSGETVFYYGTKGGGGSVTWSRAGLNHALLPAAIHFRSDNGDVIVVGAPGFGSVCAYRSNIANLATWTEVTGIPLDVLVGVRWRAVMTYRVTGQASNMTSGMWVVSGPALRPYYSPTGVAWTPGNPWTSYVAPTRTQLEDQYIKTLLQVN